MSETRQLPRSLHLEWAPDGSAHYDIDYDQCGLTTREALTAAVDALLEEIDAIDIELREKYEQEYPIAAPVMED